MSVMDDIRGPGNRGGQRDQREHRTAAHPAPGRCHRSGSTRNGGPVGIQRVDRLHPHPRRAPPVPGIGGPGAARRAGRARRILARLTESPSRHYRGGTGRTQATPTRHTSPIGGTRRLGHGPNYGRRDDRGERVSTAITRRRGGPIHDHHGLMDTGRFRLGHRGCHRRRRVGGWRRPWRGCPRRPRRRCRLRHRQGHPRRQNHDQPPF